MIIVIVGPTGVGKTKLSIELAKKYNAEIINADSIQVYRSLDIGTAKITEDEKEKIPHHLFDICDVNYLYTIYDYQKDSRKKIKEILSRGHNVIIVGGSGLYIKACLYDYDLNKENFISNNYDNLSNEEIYNRILKFKDDIDIHINNRKRLVRLLNKLENNIKTTNNKNNKLYNFIAIGLTTDRDNLYSIINNRVDDMIKKGLLNEVKSLYDNNVQSKAIDTAIGYKELYKYFNGFYSLEESINLIKKNSRRYAKRQYTFFNNQMDVKWFNTDYSNFNNTVDTITNYIESK